jgi:hypothetical protein
VVGDDNYGGGEDSFATYTSLVRCLKKKKKFSEIKDKPPSSPNDQPNTISCTLLVMYV